MSDKIFKRIVKKNYNNELEEVLQKKDFTEEVKNTLLSILYKIENGYNDYSTVKRVTLTKQEYLKKIIEIIDKDCDKIEFISLNSKKKECVDRENKKIFTKPIDNKILYSIAKIQKRNVVVKYLDETIEEALSFVLNTGNNINLVEPLRDFNGFSWNILVKDIEDLNCNLIYQNIIYLMGNIFVDKWVNNYEPLVDYFDLFQSKIENKYGTDLKEKIVENFIKLAITIKSSQDRDFKAKIIEKQNLLDKEYLKMQNREEFLCEASKSKKEKQKQIKEIDHMMIDKEALIQEYERRNMNLPIEKKIFSIRVLKNILKEERTKILAEIDELNKIMNPKAFLEKKKVLELKRKYIRIENDIYLKLIDLQKDIIKCMYIDIKNWAEKSEIKSAIYNFRYYSLLPITTDMCILEDKNLKEETKYLGKFLIKKANDMKVINQIAKNENLNYDLTEKIIVSKIIFLEDINIKLVEGTGKINLTIYDEEIEDSKIILKDIPKEEINIKSNKKIKLFI